MRVRGLPLAIAVALVLAALAASAVLALGRGDTGQEAGSSPAARSDRDAGEGAGPRAGGRPLELGLTEFNPFLLATGPVPEGFGPWRDAAVALRPDRFRLVVDWSRLQPAAEQPADLAAPADGCLRGIPPCGPFPGIRGMLRALADRQAADGGWEVVVVLTGVPDWAARPPSGCERPGARPRSRPLTPAGERAYQRLIGDLLALGRAERVALRWWSPWNEPNHPSFISPQRRECDTGSATLSAARYARLVRLARGALAGSGARLVLGELAGFRRPTARGTGVGEFVRALPDDVVCAASVWAQHEYAIPFEETAPPFARDAVAELQDALYERPCTALAPIWVTETGVGGTPPGAERPTELALLASQCLAQAVRLERWAADPLVTAVFQYLFREDTAYPVGLADPTLALRYPTYDLWLTWSRARGQAPRRPAGCGEEG